MIEIIVGAVVVALVTRAIALFVSRWAAREVEQAQRRTFDRIMRASTPPCAPGLKSSHRRIS